MVKKDTGIDRRVKIVLDKENYLASGPKDKHDAAKTWWVKFHPPLFLLFLHNACHTSSPFLLAPRVWHVFISVGGVMLTTMNRKITVDNTLDARLGFVMKECLPQVRKLLFPVQ